MNTVFEKYNSVQLFEEVYIKEELSEDEGNSSQTINYSSTNEDVECKGPQGNNAAASREGNVTPLSQQSSLGLSDQNFNTFVDIDIKHDPSVTGIEIFDGAKKPSQLRTKPAAKGPLTDAERILILALKKEKVSIKEICRYTGRAKSTVLALVAAVRLLPPNELPKAKGPSGRKRKTTAETDQLVKEAVIKDPTLTARRLKEMFPDRLKDVADRTLQKRIFNELNTPRYSNLI